MNTSEYTRSGGGLLLWLLVVACCGDAEARDIYRWTDTHGHTHFSDTPRGTHAPPPVRIATDKPSSAAGLRAGERAGLRDIELRRQQRHRQTETARRKVRHLRDSREQACRERHEQQRRGRRHVDGKAISRYLRTHCW